MAIIFVHLLPDLGGQSSNVIPHPPRRPVPLRRHQRTRYPSNSEDNKQTDQLTPATFYYTIWKPISLMRMRSMLIFNTLSVMLRVICSRQAALPSALATSGTATSPPNRQSSTMSQRRGDPSLHMVVWASSRETCLLFLADQWWIHASCLFYCMVWKTGASHRSRYKC